MDAKERELTDAILDAAVEASKSEVELAAKAANYGPDDSADYYLASDVQDLDATKRAFGEALAAWFVYKVGQCEVIRTVTPTETLPEELRAVARVVVRGRR